MKKLFWILLPALLLTACAVNKRPDWVSSQNSDQAYYTSIVAIPKQVPDYRDQARANALRDISMQINVSVRSELETRERENAGYVFSTLASSIQSSTTALLEEVELFRAHEDKRYYYAWYRLSKIHYRQQREARKRIVLDQALQAVEAFDRSQANLSTNLYALITAIESLEPFADLDLRVSLNGRSENLYTVALSRLRTLPEKIIPGFPVQSVTQTALQAISFNLKGKLLYQKNAGEEYYLSSFPVNVSFSRGSGQLIADSQTDGSGEVNLHLSRINSLEPRQEIVFYIDQEQLAARCTSPNLAQSIRQLQFAKARLVLEIIRPTLYLDFSSESPDDRQYKERLAGKLLELGLEVVERATLSDYRLQIRINTRAGNYISAVNVYSTTADIQVNLIDQRNNQVVNSNSFPGIKGTGSTQEMADFRARQNAVRLLNDEILYRMLNQSILAP